LTNDYDDFVDDLWIEDQDFRIEFARCGLGLAGESGEVAELIKKVLRGDGLLDNERVASELGDVLFYLTKAAHLMGYTLEGIQSLNVDKLSDRRSRGVIKGSGDDR
jgi:NTP pyrophosphatase (non-canonical NTP hydrolase)